jgi:hypothetical protein
MSLRVLEEGGATSDRFLSLTTVTVGSAPEILRGGTIMELGMSKVLTA